MLGRSGWLRRRSNIYPGGPFLFSNWYRTLCAFHFVCFQFWTFSLNSLLAPSCRSGINKTRTKQRSYLLHFSAISLCLSWALLVSNSSSIDGKDIKFCVIYVSNFTSTFAPSLCCYICYWGEEVFLVACSPSWCLKC